MEMSGLYFSVCHLEKCEDTIGIITNCKWRDKQYNDQKLEDTIGVITNCKSKDRQYNDQKKNKGQTLIYKILDRKVKIELHESHKKPGVNSC